MAGLSLDISIPLRDFTVEVAFDVSGGALALAGPSGAGKTTLLRAIAGLQAPAEGRISLNGEVWFDSKQNVDVPVEVRRAGFLFQDGALFPHMTVRGNVAYAATGDVDALLERFGIGHLADAKPLDISGGEKRRVALARTIATDPAVLLLDEPTAGLDKRAAATVRSELRRVLAECRIPAIVVTHDFEEASTLAGDVGVLAGGALVQRGTPGDLVAAPIDPSVADFTGANVLHGTATSTPGGLTEIALTTGGVIYSTDTADGEVDVVVHPWEVTVGLTRTEDSSLNHITAPVTSVVPVGNRARVKVGPVVAELTVASAERLGLTEGRVAIASFKATATRLLSKTVTR